MKLREARESFLRGLSQEQLEKRVALAHGIESMCNDFLYNLAQEVNPDIDEDLVEGNTYVLRDKIISVIDIQAMTTSDKLSLSTAIRFAGLELPEVSIDIEGEINADFFNIKIQLFALTGRHANIKMNKRFSNIKERSLTDIAGSFIKDLAANYDDLVSGNEAEKKIEDIAGCFIKDLAANYDQIAARYEKLTDLVF